MTESLNIAVKAPDNLIANNVMRHDYRPLTDLEKQQMQHVKDAGLVFWNVVNNIGGNRDDGVPLTSRELQLAKTKIEEAVMWATKHLTA